MLLVIGGSQDSSLAGWDVVSEKDTFKAKERAASLASQPQEATSNCVNDEERQSVCLS